jgi:hypothetical protein
MLRWPGTCAWGVVIFSYDGALGFGVTGHYDRAPDSGARG